MLSRFRVFSAIAAFTAVHVPILAQNPPPLSFVQKNCATCHNASLASGNVNFSALSGAQRQRVLWASTGTKDPAYPDTLYVDELIGPDTVNTLPPATLAAFQDHGHPARSVDRDVAAAEKVLADLERIGVSVPAACEKLLQSGVTSFATSLDDLFGLLGERRAALLAGGKPKAQ